MRRMSPARRGPLETMAGLSLAGSVLVLMVVLMVLMVLVGGCTGSDPAPAPTSAHPGTAATPTGTTPTAKPTDVAAAAAIAAVKKLYAEYNAMLSSGSTAAYRKTFSKTCNFCVQDADGVDGIFAKGETIKGGAIDVSGLRVALVHAGLVVIEGDQTDSPAVALKGRKVVARYAGGSTSHLTWRVELVGEAWLVADESPVR